jgi:outer membrane protein
MMVCVAASSGQETPAQLTLMDAIGLAKANNPTFLSAQNDQSAANWQVREAYAQFLPSVNAGISGTWQQAGAQRFGTIVLADQITDWYYSGYSVNFGMTIDGNTIFGIPNARANKRATEARIDAAEFNLESTVAFQYMAVLRAQDGVDVAQRQLDRAGQNLRIVNTRVSTGAAAGTEGRQAEVDLGRADVALIQAQRDLRQARFMLAEQVGVSIAESVVLSSEFELFEPDFDLPQLLQTAQTGHPSLSAFRAQESATRAQARQTSTSQYLPSLRLSASLRGQAQEALNRNFILTQEQDRAASRVSNCEYQNALHNGIAGGLPGYTIQDCSAFAFTPQAGEEAIAANDAFPFDFTTIPATISATFSIPVFTGFSRQRQVAEANNAAEDAEHNRRAEELRLRTMVTNAYDNVASAYRVVQAESRNRTLSEEQLQLQQRRYALGAAGLLELMDAQTSVTTAEQAYLNAVYDFHYNLIALEAAVGQPLRPR